MKVTQTANLTRTGLAIPNRLLIVPIVSLLTMITSPTPAQQVPVMAMPQTYSTFDNLEQMYDYGQAEGYGYNATTNRYSYLPANPNLQGVPNKALSYILTWDNIWLMNTVLLKNGQYVVPSPGAGMSVTAPTPPGNTSLGGYLDGGKGFTWGSVDVVMQQCFGGGFAFDMAGSLQGAVPAGGGAVVAPVNKVNYTFTAAANYNEVAIAYVDPPAYPPPGTAPATVATMDLLGDFTQGHATNVAAPTLGTLYQSYTFAVDEDPYVDGTTPTFGVTNRVPLTLLNGGFESPVYGSPDAMIGGGGVINPKGNNNSRTYQTNSSNRWALLFAPNPDAVFFAYEIEREYAALLSAGVSKGHIAVLYRDGTFDGTPQCLNGAAQCLPRFNAINNNNNSPTVNALLDKYLGANVPIPINGAATWANITGLLNLSFSAASNYWQTLVGATPHNTGDSLLLYVTGHGDAVRPNGAYFQAVNSQLNGGTQYQTQINLAVPDNVQIVGSQTYTGQIAMQSPLLDPPSSYTITVGGLAAGSLTQASLTSAPPTAIDMSTILQPTNGSSLTYYTFSLPTGTTSGPSASQPLNFTISNSDPNAIASFDNNVLAITFMDGTPSTCAGGACDFYTDTLTDLSLSASAETVSPGQFITLTATVMGTDPTGTIQFFENGNPINSLVNVGANGIATLNYTPSLPGPDVVTAYYSGDSNDLPGYADVVDIDVSNNGASGGTDSPTLPQWSAIVMGLALASLSIFQIRRSNPKHSFCKSLM